MFLCISANRTPSRRRRAGAYAGGYASSGGGAGGYTGTFNSGGGGGGYYDYDDYDGSSPNFGIIDPYLFHQQLTNHILAQNYANQQWASVLCPGDLGLDHGLVEGGFGFT